MPQQYAKEAEMEQTHWYDRIWAALIFFTRIPFWRLHQPPQACYRTVVEHWPLTGWLTGGVAAVTLWVCSQHLPYALAVLLAIVARLLLTGALHEDGLADFMDGFGGGTDRNRILAIMKDSHIGTFGVLGLILYELMLAASLFSLSPLMAAVAIWAADPFAKMLTAPLVVVMPYARREEEAKAKVVYRSMSWWAGVSLLIQGVLPMGIFIWLTNIYWGWLVIVPTLVMTLLSLHIWRRLRGYTGDCCGALFLLIELSCGTLDTDGRGRGDGQMTVGIKE